MGYLATTVELPPTYGPRLLLPDLGASTKQANRPVLSFGETITYTIAVRNTGATLTSTLRLTDTLPIGLAYISGNLTSTSGTVDASQSPMLRWSGSLSQTPTVTITYAASVTETNARVLTSMAIIDAGPAGQWLCRATIVVNGYAVYLPLARR